MKDLSGNRYGKWTVIGFGKKSKTTYYWDCICDCGTRRFVNASSLKRGMSKSCGCAEPKKNPWHTHGGRSDRLYGVWRGIKTRCYNKNDKSYKDYGARGIAMCDEWKNNYASFKEWAIKNGYDDTAKKNVCTIDRIDNSKNYEPSNCRFANMKTQSNNRRSNHFLTLNGESHTIKEWSEITGMSYAMLKKRVQFGWDDEKILKTPKKHTI